MRGAVVQKLYRLAPYTSPDVTVGTGNTAPLLCGVVGSPVTKGTDWAAVCLVGRQLGQPL